MPLLNVHARISLCGLISQYGNENDQDPPHLWRTRGNAAFERNSVVVHDLFVGNFVAQYQDRFLEEMGGYLRAGDVRYLEDKRLGLENTPAVFAQMLAGGTLGKTLVVVSEDPTLSS